MGSHDNIMLFEGTSFHTWQVKLKAQLMQKGKWGVVNGTDEKTNTREGGLAWQVRDEKAQGIIIRWLHDTYIHYLDTCTTSCESWATLQALFGAERKNTKYALLIEYFRLQLSQGESLSSHLNHMKSLLTQLTGIKMKMDEDIQIVVLLESLPEDFSTLVTTLTNLPKPTLKDVEASLLEEENKMKRSHVVSYDNAYYTNNKKPVKGSTSKVSKVKCHFCGREGHIEKNCFIKQKISANLIEDKATSEEVAATVEEGPCHEEANFISEEWAF